MQIGIAKPFIGDEEKQAVLAVLDSGQLIRGAKVAEFEQAFAAYHGAKHGIATSNGTTALMAANNGHGIGCGGEGIIPSFSLFFSATCHLRVRGGGGFSEIDTPTISL